MEELIETSQFFLFNILISSIEGVGYKWAEEFGAPIKYIKNPTEDDIINETDYLICKYDGSPQLHRLIFKFMKTGKHGTVIEDKKFN